MPRLLLIDDDLELCELLLEYLQLEGFSVDLVHDGQVAIEQVLKNDYDLLLLDVMLPNLNGFDVLRHIRQTNPVPVIMLTAKGDDIDRIVGLEMGADDYLPKPCNPRELVARVRAILRRVPDQPQNLQNPVVISDVELNPAQRTVICNGQRLGLTSTEFSVLEILMRAAGQVVSKADLTEQALARKLLTYDRSIDMHVSHVRRKLGTYRDGSARIETVRGVGYLYRRLD